MKEVSISRPYEDGAAYFYDIRQSLRWLAGCGGCTRLAMATTHQQPNTGCDKMSEKAASKLKAALDETRLLILGVQILLGFEFQSVFQDGFDGLGPLSKYLSLGALGLIVLSIAILIAPSMQHRLVEDGRSTARLIEMTNRLAAAALVPLTLGLTLSTYVVTERTFGFAVGIATAALLGCASTFCWFGLEILIVGRRKEMEKMQQSPTPLKTKIEQLLTEARLIIPGGQALFGFQFIAMLTSGFDRLPEIAKVVHAIALCLVGMNVIIMMTPAALHRLSFGGEDSGRFFRLGSALVTVGPVFLATGICAEVYVVFLKALNSSQVAVAASVGTAILLAGLWYVWPLSLRNSCR
jgi:hypothetical protein